MDIPATVVPFCTIAEDAAISLASVARLLHRNLPHLAEEIATIGALVQTPADERTLLAVLLMREFHRSSSPLMPYLQALVSSAQCPQIPHKHVLLVIHIARLADRSLNILTLRPVADREFPQIVDL